MYYGSKNALNIDRVYTTDLTSFEKRFFSPLHGPLISLHGLKKHGHVITSLLTRSACNQQTCDHVIIFSKQRSEINGRLRWVVWHYVSISTLCCCFNFSWALE